MRKRPAAKKGGKVVAGKGAAAAAATEDDATTKVKTRRQSTLHESWGGTAAKKQQPPKEAAAKPPPESHGCPKCNRTFNSLAGCRRHMRFCRESSTATTNNGSTGGRSEAPQQVGSSSVREVVTSEYEEEDDPPEVDEAAHRREAAGEDVSPAGAEDEEDGEGSGGEAAHENISPEKRALMVNKFNDMLDDSCEEPGKCHCCGEDLNTAHTGGEFECADCSKNFKLKSSLERHRRVVHLEGETYTCPVCNARCPDKGTLARHMYTHTGKYML